jgi:hypothetical protein
MIDLDSLLAMLAMDRGQWQWWASERSAYLADATALTAGLAVLESIANKSKEWNLDLGVRQLN